MPTDQFEHPELYKNLLLQIYKCIGPEGILASPSQIDNYNRVWSRDAMMSGIIGIICDDNKIIEGLKNSVFTLAKYQNEFGQIPSNVQIGNDVKVSYGTLVGRVDATTWWIIGVCALLQHPQYKHHEKELTTPIYKALSLLRIWEFNGRGFIYTPLGGNWADEYICEGYTLYDQCLRLWSLKLVSKVYNDNHLKNQSEKLAQLIISNFYGGSVVDEEKYHPKAYRNALASKVNYFWFQFNSNGYDTRWDMAGNALVLLLGLHPKPAQILEFINDLHNKQKSWMLPVFYPVITPSDYEWKLLENNFSYQFKNKPYHFHNGGSWPIFLGWLGAGLAIHGYKETSDNIFEELNTHLQNEQPPYSYHEYWSTDTFTPKGTSPLCFTMSGFLLLNHIKQNTSYESIKKLFV